MISLEKCKELNKPNIITRSSSRWTHLAKKGGLNYNGLAYVETTFPLELYNKARLFGGNDFWDRNDSENENKWRDNPQYRKDVEQWIKTEEKKLREKIKNSNMGR